MDNNINFKPSEMFFYLYEFGIAMDVLHAKSLFEVHYGLAQLAHMNRWGWLIQAVDRLNVLNSSYLLSMHRLSDSAKQSIPLVM